MGLPARAIRGDRGRRLLLQQLLAYISDAFFGNLPGLVSVPRSRVYGAEVDLRWLPVHGLTLSVSGSYVNSSVTSDFATLGPVGSSGFVDVRGSAFYPEVECPRGR